MNNVTKKALTTKFVVPDGLAEIAHAMPSVMELIVRTARWVHPNTFRALPVWYPEVARGRLLYDANWTRPYTNTKTASKTTSPKPEQNLFGSRSLRTALGVSGKTKNWTVCHIWGVDDPRFEKTNHVVQDSRYYSCIANMVWLPTPLKGFTDAVPSVKLMLRTCAFHLYGWACEHTDVASQANQIRNGSIPEEYPEQWPAPNKNVLPPNTAPFSPTIITAIEKRKADIKKKLTDHSYTHYPRDEVQEVLKFWKIEL